MVAVITVVDANIVIAHLDADNALHEEASAALATIPKPERGIAAITRSEVLVAFARAGILDQGRAVFTNLGITTLPLPPADQWADSIATLRASTRLKTPDAIVLDAALRSHAAVASLDFALRRAAQGAGLPLVPPLLD